MKEQISIPTTKVQRAARFVKTGAKVGGNYIKHYTKKILDPDLSKDELDKENAEDIYGSLSELKGSALKVAQMLAMDKNLLPQAYQNQFAMAQYSAPPLSYPLVVKTFNKYFGKGPNEIFDKFSKNAVNAASIGQVHEAYLDGKRLAVKIQYPGVANSVSSDLKLVKPFALRLFNLSEKELGQYLEEVESKLLEETDYELELKRSKEITGACSHLKNLVFPDYYEEYSSDRIITMDWVDGKHLKEFLADDPTTEARTMIGQALWDFYDHQVHALKQVHADPHPGNFLMQPDGTLGVIDFGCVKEIPQDFYEGYFKLIRKDIVKNEGEIEEAFLDLGIIFDTDSEKDKRFFINVFKEMISLLGRPFHSETFDFADDAYFTEIFELSERLSNMKELKNSRQARGSRHALYINRTYFGLYNLLNDLKVEIKTTKPDWLK
ncbi:MAG: AarF/UbiB family protein [Cyclobacteriaceae bacterium]